MATRQSIPDRFFDKLIPEPNSGCLLWIGSTNTNGYGQIETERRTRNVWLTHRLAWVFAHGPIPPGLHVLHRCDVPLCCNPNHLFLGTHTDNLRDASRKGRMHPGERNGMSKLTAEEVHDIKRLRETEKLSYREIGERFGVNYATVGDIIRGKCWQHIP